MGLLMKLRVLGELEGRSAELFDSLGLHFGTDEELSLLFIQMGLNGFSRQSVLRYLDQVAVKNPREGRDSGSMEGRLERVRGELEMFRSRSLSLTGPEALQQALQLHSSLMEAYAEESLLDGPPGLVRLIIHLHADCRDRIRELQAVLRARADRWGVLRTRSTLERRHSPGR